MNLLDQVREDREDLARVLKKHKGIRRIVEELYPDSAHFIYELLQNAEDTYATEVNFILNKDGLAFEHNGRPFDENDIWAITDIGEGTKSADDDKIGRFGVGFKAVFAYSETPHIWSPTFCFKISDLVLPSAINVKPELEGKTRFEFPFNNPKKTPEDAFSEVKASLNELAETTLLFLTHLESIRWQIGRKITEVLRISHSKHHFEVLKQTDGKTTTSAHFLRFSESVKGMETQHVAIAYELEFLPKVNTFNSKKAIAKQLKITSANPGRVAVFFPAEKETSALRFHLHAPFVPELSRASIKETPANEPLFEQVAGLAASSLHIVRELNLLTGDFLAVLPNGHDALPKRYEAIRDAIIEEMNNEPLTPTHAKKHAPAKFLLQAKASLKGLLTEDDLEFLVDYDDDPPVWAIGASQKNSNQDRFLSGLAIREWDIESFVQMVEEKASADRRYLISLYKYVNGPDEDFMKWLAVKSEEWHQQMYSLLYKELKPEDELDRINELKIVRLSVGSYSVGSKCYFPGNGVEHDDTLPRVAKEVYSSGKSKLQQETAMKLLEEIGVREVGEAEEIEAILKQRYTPEDKDFDEKKYLRDLKRFISMVDKDPKQAGLFTAYLIFECVDGLWRSPDAVFIDDPYLETGLSIYYRELGEDVERFALSQKYRDCGIKVEKIVRFALDVGVQKSLTINKVSTNKHLMSSNLRRDYYKYNVKWTNTAIDTNWTIKNLEKLLKNASKALSQLIWNTMVNANSQVLKARFRPNQQYPIRYEPSSLVLTLRKMSWIPQGKDEFVVPRQASRENLPKGFPFDEGYEWLEAINFGEDIRQQSEEHRKREAVAKELGFEDPKSLERARKFIELFPEEDQERILSEYQNRKATDLPENEPRNPEHRAQRVGEQASEAPGRNTEKRSRSVSVGREEVKQEADQYLRQQYTNGDGEMICQVCKKPLPFKLDDGNYYFEKVELLTDLKNRYYQNYLTLCPNHSAMFRHANGTRELINDMFQDLSENELEVVLAQDNHTIYFTQTHINDLKVVIEVDKNGSEE